MRGVAEADIDIIVAALHTEHGFGRTVEQGAGLCARGADAAVDAIVELMELITVDGIGCVPGKIIEQVHGFFDQIGVCLPQPGVIGLRKSGGENKPAGVAAVRRVEFTERTDLSGGDGPQRDLIRRVPVIGVRHVSERHLPNRRRGRSGDV